MILVVTPLYAGLLGLLFTFLSLRVIRTRRRCHVPLGDGGEKALLRCLRVQANFAEYVPFCLLLMTLAELQGLPGWLLHSMGLALLTGRLARLTDDHCLLAASDPKLEKVELSLVARHALELRRRNGDNGQAIVKRFGSSSNSGRGRNGNPR